MFSTFLHSPSDKLSTRRPSLTIMDCYPCNIKINSTCCNKTYQKFVNLHCKPDGRKMFLLFGNIMPYLEQGNYTNNIMHTSSSTLRLSNYLIRRRRKCYILNITSKLVTYIILLFTTNIRFHCYIHLYINNKSSISTFLNTVYFVLELTGFSHE